SGGDCAHVALLREIAHHELDPLVIALGFPLRDDPLALFAVPRDDRERGPAARESAARGLADPFGRARHEEDFAVEIAHRSPPGVSLSDYAEVEAMQCGVAERKLDVGFA